MFRHLSKIAARNLIKQGHFSLINILGLALGMSSFFLIILYCWHEFNYDNFHPNKSDIYRIEYSMERGGMTKTMGRTPPAIAPLLKDYFPEFTEVSRFYPRSLSAMAPKTQRAIEVKNVFFVDTSAVDIFEFQFLEGSHNQVLHQPNDVIITNELAQKLFGQINIVGESISLAGQDDFTIAGVVQKWPDNVHLEFDMLLPYQSMVKVEPTHAREGIQNFINHNLSATHSYTYVKVLPNQSPEKINARFKSFIDEKGQEGVKEIQTFTLMPVTDIHLFSETGGPKPPGNLSYLYLFLAMGAMTLFIACINFVNLSTASAMIRAKEIIVRKLLGAQRKILIQQFLGEAMLLSFIAFIIAITVTQLLLPYFNGLTDVQITQSSLFEPSIILIFISIFVLAGLIAGLYPAIFVSRFQPAEAIKKAIGTNKVGSSTWVRKGLITLQFIAAISFITGAFILQQQINFLHNQPLGFQEELMIGLPLNSKNNLNAILRPGDPTLRQRMNAFDNQLLEHPHIKAVTQCSEMPGLGAVAHRVSSDSTTLNTNLVSSVLFVDYDFVETFDINLEIGRDFDAGYGTDHIDAFMVNEKAIALLGWDSPETALGQAMSVGGKEGKVIGILEDFHFQSLHSEIQPLILEVNPGGFGYFALQIDNTNIQETLAFIKAQWKIAFPEKVFDYAFLDDSLNDIYSTERKLATIINYAALITIFIACFGLFGLTALLTQQRFKEIGIRKVLGASIRHILQLLTKDYLKLVLVAMLIATPLVWYFSGLWLADFAYAITFPWWLTFLSGFLVMIAAFFVVSTQSIKAALSNPIDAIKEA